MVIKYQLRTLIVMTAFASMVQHRSPAAPLREAVQAMNEQLRQVAELILFIVFSKVVAIHAGLQLLFRLHLEKLILELCRASLRYQNHYLWPPVKVHRMILQADNYRIGGHLCFKHELLADGLPIGSVASQYLADKNAGVAILC